MIELFAAGHGDALDELLLEQQVEDHHGNHGQKASGHQNREIGGVLTVQSGQTCGQGHHVQIRVADQGPHQICVGKHRCEDGQCRDAGFGQGQQHLGKGLPFGAAIQIGCLGNFVGNAHIGLPQEKGAEGTDKAREYQGENGVGKSHFCQHLILRDDENLAGQHHLHQNKTEQQIFAGELQLGKGVARHGAEHHRADHPEENQQEGIDVKIPEGQTLQGFDEVVEIPLSRENLGWYCHGFCLGFEAGQQHPGKGEDHGDAARD